MNQLVINKIDSEIFMNRTFSKSGDPDVLTDIYKDDVNIAIWQRTLTSELLKASEYIIKSTPSIQFSSLITPKDTFNALHEALGKTSQAALISTDIAEIVGMFCCLFDLQQVGLRLAVLDRAMCPKFHVDRVPCRLVTTYNGIATEWLSHSDVDRDKLGVGSQGLSDEMSGLYRSDNNINQLSYGDVGLLKGESWFDNEGGGLVHRSPSLQNANKRLLLTLDFA